MRMLSFGAMAEDCSPSPTRSTPAKSRREDQIGPAWLRRALWPGWWSYLVGKAKPSPSAGLGYGFPQGRSTLSVRPDHTAKLGLGSGSLASSPSPFFGARTTWRGQDLAGFSGEQVWKAVGQLPGMLVSLPFSLQVSPPLDLSAVYSFGTL